MPVPITKTWQELGFSGIPEARGPARETGGEWLKGQSEAVQVQVLGPGKAALYREGKLALSDLVDYRHDPQWGPSRTEKTLAEVAP